MKKLYEKVYIKSRADLPKEDGDYIVHSKLHGWIGLHNWKTFENLIKQATAAIYEYHNYPEYSQYLWLLNIDWYLQPIEQSESVTVSDEEIEEKAHELAQFKGFDNELNWNVKIEVNCIRIAKWLLSKIEKTI